MFVRSALIACAALVATAAPAFADEPARCDATSFRIYFGANADTLDASAREILAAAERNVASCGYAELRVTLDASSPYAAERAQAIRAAADARTWDAVRVEARPMLQRAAHRAGPDYAEVTMTPDVGADRNQRIAPPNVGL
ncbi:hypothetical protein U91I_01786 [alpha proteobacterium U9-1i]|nr:hypothetical protein U91I_01786 [alpha proteobacterium U9-1i]